MWRRRPAQRGSETTIPPIPSILLYYDPTCISNEEAPFPYKLTRPCQIVRVTPRRLSQLSSRHLLSSPPWDAISLMDNPIPSNIHPDGAVSDTLWLSTRQSSAALRVRVVLLLPNYLARTLGRDGRHRRDGLAAGRIVRVRRQAEGVAQWLGHSRGHTS